MLMRVGAMLALGFCSAIAANAQDTPDARALAQAMRVSESTRMGLEAGAQRQLQQGSGSQKQLDCIKAADLGFAVDAYVAAIERGLSPAEIKDAVKFFGSPEGQAYLDYSRSLEMKSRNLPDPKPKAELTDKETAATTRFMEKSAGKKILEDHVLETSELKKALTAGVTGLLGRCRG